MKNNIVMRYSIAGIAALSVMLLLSISSCQPKGSGAEKPSVDSAKIIELVELYRAKRYEDIQGAIAAGEDQVYKISFNGRNLGSISPEIARFKYLATLDVAYNNLNELPEEIASLHYLQGLYANGNNLTEFPGQILLLPLLSRVNLSENQIASMPPEIMKMDQLTFLAMEKNTLTGIPVQLYELENLVVLNLASNGLSVIPEGISQLSSLKKLDLSHNQLTTVPKEITTIGNHLVDLMVHGNNIPKEEIDWLIEAMPQTRIRF